MIRTLSLILAVTLAAPVALAQQPVATDAQLQARLTASAADVAAAEQLAGRHMARSQPAQAAQVYARSLAAVPGWAQGHFLLARAYEAAGNLAYAEVAYGNHLRMAPASPQTLFALASVLDRQGKGAQAIDRYQQFLRTGVAVGVADPQGAHARSRIQALGGVPPAAQVVPPPPPPLAAPPPAAAPPAAARRHAAPRAPGLPPPKGERPGGYVLLHRAGAETVAGVDVALFTFEDRVEEDASVYQLEAYVAWPVFDSWVAFAAWPTSWLRRTPEEDGEAARGDIDLGVAWLYGGGLFEMAARAGLGLPVASSSNEELAANVLATSVRPRQLTLIDNDVSYFRLSATPTLRVDLLFVAMDLGLSIPGLDEASTGRKTDAIGHFGLALGANIDALRLMVETSSGKLATAAAGQEEDAGATALSARWTKGRFRPGVAWVVPSDLVDEFVDSIFVFSLQVVTGPRPDARTRRTPLDAPAARTSAFPRP